MKSFEMQGIISNMNTMEFEPAELLVGISNDKLGRSISIGDEKTGITYQIPFEPIAQYLER